MPGYLDTYYSNGSGTWTALVLNDSELRAGVNLELSRGAYASGHVYDQDTGAPVAGALVSIRYSASELGATNAVSAADGSYQTSAVPTGTYYAFAKVPGLGTFVWPGVPCQEPCVLTPAEALLLDQTIEYPDTDFRLPHIDLIMRSSFD
ncbi:MAG: carboxypeptidase-like regulatory domain-containing protein [Dokdonella sp.]